MFSVVLGSDDDSSSVSSLTGSDLEVDEEVDRNSQLSALQLARDRKIQMSAEKKQAGSTGKGGLCASDH